MSTPLIMDRLPDMVYYPVYLDLNGRECVVIGGGDIAQSKVSPLVESGAAVTVIAPELVAGLSMLVKSGDISHLNRKYQTGDLKGKFLAISATDDSETNHAVFAEAKERQILVNVVDDKERCGFIVPSVVRRGDLTIAISTAGHAPALSARIRQRLEKLFGDEYAQFLMWAGSVRKHLAQTVPDAEERTSRWYRLVDSDIFQLLRNSDHTRARELFTQLLGVSPQDGEAGQ